MKNIVITILMAFLLVGVVSAVVDIDVLGIYDRNGDDIIDAQERIALDIDIENCRVDFGESAYAGMLTTSGTIILTDELEAAAFGETPRTDTEVIVELVLPEPVVVDVIEAAEDVPAVPGDVITVTEEDDAPLLGWYMWIIAIIVVIMLICFIVLMDKDNNGSIVETEKKD